MDSDSVWHLFPVLVDPERKVDFMTYLNQNGVASGEHYPIPIPDQKAMMHIRHELSSDCGTARRIARSEVSLPIHPYLTGEEVARVIEVCNAWPVSF